tara:strand:- start:1441 stop:1542 length:102 start_codon:yes stop_codon:yes gene_type:complete
LVVVEEEDQQLVVVVVLEDIEPPCQKVLVELRQ